VRPRGAGGRSAVIGPATVTASSSLITPDQRDHPSGGHGRSDSTHRQLRGGRGDQCTTLVVVISSRSSGP
jgi:hypothetical protein